PTMHVFSNLSLHDALPILVQKHLNQDLMIEGVLLTMLDARTNLGIQVIQEVKKYFQNKVYQTIIPRNIRLSEAPSHGQPIIQYEDRKSTRLNSSHVKISYA